MWSFVARCVDVRLAACAAVALLVLPGQAIAQTGPLGPRPNLNRTPHALSPPANRRPQMDLLDLRDRHDLVTSVTPLSAASNIIQCVAGCGDTGSKPISAVPQNAGAFLAVVGPIEVGPIQAGLIQAGPIEDARLIKAAVIAPTMAPVPSVADQGVITCLAGCDASDRRVMQATGGPRPILPRHQLEITPRLITAAAAPMSGPAPVKTALKRTPQVLTPTAGATRQISTASAPLKLKRSYTAHAKQVEKRNKIAARTPATTRIVTVKTATTRKPALPQLAAVGAPAPIQPPQPGPKPQPAIAKTQPVVSPKRPVSVNTSSDWFNKISRDQAAKKNDASAQ